MSGPIYCITKHNLPENASAATADERQAACISDRGAKGDAKFDNMS